MTKGDLLNLLAPYGLAEQVVFVTFEDGITVHEEVEVAKNHSTTRTAPSGEVYMPVAIYLVDFGKQGRAGVIGLAPSDILPQGWPRASEEPPQPSTGS